MAQIATEVRRGYVKTPKNVKLRDFLLQTTSKAKEAAAKSKAVWLTALRLKKPQKKD